MEKHFNTLDKKQASLDHQDWKQVTLKSKQSISQEKKQSTKKISLAQLYHVTNGNKTLFQPILPVGTLALSSI